MALDVQHASGLGTGALCLLPGALIVYLGFNAGGFFPDTTAIVTIVLLAVLGLRICVARSPFEGFNRSLAIAAAGLALYALWTLVSGRWSDAPARALLEFDRALLYLVTLVLFGSIGRTTARLRWMLRSVALGIAVVCLAGLISRLLPEVWPVEEGFLAERLSFPVTYWNSLGIMASVGVILCLHFASGRSEPWLVRVLGAAAVPPLAATLLLTYSRGAIAAGAIGVLAYVFIARPRALLSCLLATVPPTIVAVIVTYDADLLSSENPTSSAAVTQGHRAALVVGLCTVAAALTRWALVWLDRRPLTFGPRLQGAAWYGLAAILIVGTLALNVPGYVGDQYDRFVHTSAPSGDVRERIFDPSNNGRLAHWDVALDTFRESKLHGEGAGTYQLSWAQHRPVSLAELYVRDAHSLYVEVLGELGIVGLLLLLVVLGTIFFRLASGLLGPNRTLYGALFAATLTLAIHAGVDWDWEMPVVMIWLFALAGAALAAPSRRRFPSHPLSVPVRVLAAAGIALLVLVPAHVAASQKKIEDSFDAYGQGDCRQAIDLARSASDTLGTRPEPHEVVGYCYLLQRRGPQAVEEMQKAVSRDPDNWEYRYDLALALGASGIDPRPAAQAALRLNPLEEITRRAVRRFDTANPHTWRRVGRTLAKETEF